MSSLRDRQAATAGIDVDGGTLVVETVGSGPALLFLHGWTLDRRASRPQIEGLPAGHLLIAYDRRGHGRSTAPPDMRREVEDVARILDALGIGRATLVAMSQGTRVALAAALRFPDRVTALALQGAPLPFPSMHDAASEAVPVAAMAALAAAGRLEELRALWLAHPLMQADASPMRALLREILDGYGARDLLKPGRPLELPRDALARLRQPTLLITGEQETSYRRSAAAELAALLPHARRIEIAGGGHLCNLSRSAAYNQALTAFLETIDAG